MLLGLQNLLQKPNSYSLAIDFHAGQPDEVLFQVWGGALPTDNETLTGVTDLSVGWHHVAAVFDNSPGTSPDTLSIYLDGTRLAFSSNRAFSPGIQASNNRLTVEEYAGANLSNGFIDEIRLSDVTRYRGACYTVPLGPFSADANTRALWHFDEVNSSPNFADSSPNGNTLRGVGGAQSEAPSAPLIRERSTLDRPTACQRFQCLSRLSEVPLR